MRTGRPRRPTTPPAPARKARRAKPPLNRHPLSRSLSRERRLVQSAAVLTTSRSSCPPQPHTHTHTRPRPRPHDDLCLCFLYLSSFFLFFFLFHPSWIRVFGIPAEEHTHTDRRRPESEPSFPQTTPAHTGRKETNDGTISDDEGPPVNRTRHTHNQSIRHKGTHGSPPCCLSSLGQPL